MKKRAFISFDFDHDETQKDFLIGQSRHPDTPFEFADWSIKEHLTGNWREKARTRIRSVDLMIVLCGHNTNYATGVSAELQIAQSESVPYFLLAAYSDGNCVAPAAARPTDKIYSWTWDNLKALTGGAR